MNPAPPEFPHDASPEKVIELDAVCKNYGRFRALDSIDLDIRRGERIIICGPSGSGKSTLIRCINRIETHDEGRIVVNGQILTEQLKDIAAVRRDVGMVFQNFNLFPHLTILENCILAPVQARITSYNVCYTKLLRAYHNQIAIFHYWVMQPTLQ